MQGGVLVARKERGGFGLATFATGIVYGLQVHFSCLACGVGGLQASQRSCALLAHRSAACGRRAGQLARLAPCAPPVSAGGSPGNGASPTPPLLASSPNPPQPDALFVIVPALALPTKLAAAAYILMFVLGTVAAMGAYTGVIGEPLAGWLVWLAGRPAGRLARLLARFSPCGIGRLHAELAGAPLGRSTARSAAL